MSSWRLAGLNYINYSNVCARVVRRCLKPELRSDAMKRDVGFIRPIHWKDGQAIVIKKSPQAIAAEEKA